MRGSPYDEMLEASGGPRSHCRDYWRWLEAQSQEHLAQKRSEADALFHRVGITFAVYGEGSGTERLIPFDIVPRIIPAEEWTRLETGLAQRVRAMNAFIGDIYHDQRILRAGVIPAERVLCNVQYRPEMQGVDVPGGIYAHIAGIDVVRDEGGKFLVLEDNLRVPSGVSYMLENRKMMMRLFPELFAHHPVAPVEQYPDLLLENLKSVAPAGVSDPTVVLLTPGMYNSAYFEHAFLAQQMGIELVEGQDLFVLDDVLYMRTTRGPQRVDVVYRRLDDDFLDPLSFRPDSTLGVPGLLTVYRAGHVAIANAIGTGIADDKSVYPYVPQMIRFYLGETPLLENVRTWILGEREDRAYALDHLQELVVKEIHGAGGYGMLIGPTATVAQLEDFRSRIRANPERYIAQPTLVLSTAPTFSIAGVAPRHIDLRPFVLSGRDVTTVPGGLTRVALREGSLVVNSSQGGGTKDTWVLGG
ncbi:MAG TPA: circularly permuted type 2 ATP-grasp protein [Steroidobacteraceae bacterium]|nr:circularly permuted type 2 ATP-grasp protein [Steroidobacteraceae bacterium]